MIAATSVVVDLIVIISGIVPVDMATMLVAMTTVVIAADTIITAAITINVTGIMAVGGIGRTHGRRPIPAIAAAAFTPPFKPRLRTPRCWFAHAEP